MSEVLAELKKNGSSGGTTEITGLAVTWIFQDGGALTYTVNQDFSVGDYMIVSASNIGTYILNNISCDKATKQQVVGPSVIFKITTAGNPVLQRTSKASGYSLGSASIIRVHS